jgi:hypothetical protein
MHQRVLYWYRTPPQVKVGREPFDEQTRRALEAQNPDIRFDWEKIRNTPIPPIQPEYWRERRLAEKAARHAAAEEKGQSEPRESSPPGASSVGASALPPDAPRGRRRRRRDRGAGPRPVAAGEPGNPPGPASVDLGETAPAEPVGNSDGIADDPQS